MQCAAAVTTTADSKSDPKVGGLYHIPRREKGATKSITALVLQAKKGTSEHETGDGTITKTVKEVKASSKRLQESAAPAGQSPAKRNNKGNLQIPHQCLHTYCQ